MAAGAEGDLKIRRGPSDHLGSVGLILVEDVTRHGRNGDGEAPRVVQTIDGGEGEIARDEEGGRKEEKGSTRSRWKTRDGRCDGPLDGGCLITVDGDVDR